MELNYQRGSKVSDIVNQDEYNIEIQKYYSGHHENSKKLQWSNQRIQSVIKLLDEYNIIKSQGVRASSKHYHYARKYDVINIGDQKVLVIKRKNISDPLVQVIPTEDYYQKILDAHIATRHGRRDRVVHALKDKYTVPIFAVLIFLNLCKTCLKTRKSYPKNKEIVPKPMSLASTTQNAVRSSPNADLSDIPENDNSLSEIENEFSLKYYNAESEDIDEEYVKDFKTEIFEMSDESPNVQLQQRPLETTPATLDPLRIREKRKLHSEDDLDSFGSYIIATLRTLNAKNSILAQDEIQRVLSKYKLRNLHDRNTSYKRRAHTSRFSSQSED